MNRKRLNKYLSAADEEPTINLTPLIDVVFVILIMFILVAPLLERDNVELADAKNTQETAAIRNKSPVTIHVDKDNTIKVNRHYITIKELPATLKDAKARHPNARPQIFHDRRAHFGTYQAIKNAAEIAGFEEMDIILKPT